MPSARGDGCARSRARRARARRRHAPWRDVRHQASGHVHRRRPEPARASITAMHPKLKSRQAPDLSAQ
jgi:hypothetical protein